MDLSTSQLWPATPSTHGDFTGMRHVSVLQNGSPMSLDGVSIHSLGGSLCSLQAVRQARAGVVWSFDCGFWAFGSPTSQRRHTGAKSV